MTVRPVRRDVAHQALVESARLGAPENWCRQLLAEAGYPLTQRVWDRTWRRVCLLVDRPGPWGRE